MGLPRWFEAYFLQAEEAGRKVDYVHLGEQVGLRIEEVLSPSALKSWFDLAGRWKEASGATSDEVAKFLEAECPEYLAKIPNDERDAFLSGLWNKRG